MMRLIQCILLVMMLVFGAAASSHALPVTCDSVDLAVTSTMDGPHPDYTGTKYASQAADDIYAGDDFFGAGVDTYGAEELNNWFFSGDTVITGTFQPPQGLEFNDGADYNDFDISATHDGIAYDFMSVKFDGYVAVLDLRGTDCDVVCWLTPYTPPDSEKQYEASHARYWNSTSVPDPAAMFLLGSACVIGFAGMRRRYLS